MKRLLLLGILAGLIFTFTAPNLMAGAVDSTRFLSTYSITGYHGDEMMYDVLQHQGPASTLARRRIYTTPIFVPATDDSVFYTIISIPPGEHFKIDSLFYGCKTEPNVATTKIVTLTILCYDSSAAALDTVVDYRTIDADSAVFNNVETNLTINSTSFQSTKILDPGDILWAQIRIDTAGVLTGKGLHVTLKGRLWD